eukprot:c19459_g1_i1.p2 GENE.c19459_g1_i1~~c19459_g1_i1.p2  ORF type:complete len:134 (+),score=25.09 c19459_g1_i1:1-402(+)
MVEATSKTEQQTSRSLGSPSHVLVIVVIVVLLIGIYCRHSTNRLAYEEVTPGQNDHMPSEVDYESALVGEDDSDARANQSFAQGISNFTAWSTNPARHVHMPLDTNDVDIFGSNSDADSSKKLVAEGWGDWES